MCVGLCCWPPFCTATYIRWILRCPSGCHIYDQIVSSLSKLILLILFCLKTSLFCQQKHCLTSVFKRKWLFFYICFCFSMTELLLNQVGSAMHVPRDSLYTIPHMRALVSKAHDKPFISGYFIFLGLYIPKIWRMLFSLIYSCFIFQKNCSSMLVLCRHYQCCDFKCRQMNSTSLLLLHSAC